MIRGKANCKTTRVTFHPRGQLQFGGCLKDVKISGLPVPAPIHHFLTLDTRDVFCPVTSITSVKIPLIYPLLYGFGGGEIQYSIRGDNEIRIHSISSYSSESSPYVDHQELPLRQVQLQPLTYAQERVFCALEGYFSRKQLSWLDRWRLSRIENGNFWRVGGHFSTCQGTVWSLCVNPECQWQHNLGGNTQSQIWPIALFKLNFPLRS